MKAVMLNSADKVQDTGNGTVRNETENVDKQNQDWLASDAYRDPKSRYTHKWVRVS